MHVDHYISIIQKADRERRRHEQRCGFSAKIGVALIISPERTWNGGVWQIISCIVVTLLFAQQSPDQIERRNRCLIIKIGFHALSTTLPQMSFSVKKTKTKLCVDFKSCNRKSICFGNSEIILKTMDFYIVHFTSIFQAQLWIRIFQTLDH